MSDAELFINGALQTWKQVISRLDQRLIPLADEELERSEAPGRNPLNYLLGHLTVAHDRMLLLLRVGERLHPELDAAFFDNPDGVVKHDFSSAELKRAWGQVNQDLTDAMLRLSAREWLERHASVSEVDFKGDPSRNRLAILLSRTNHASFHLGQIILAG